MTVDNVKPHVDICCPSPPCSPPPPYATRECRESDPNNGLETFVEQVADAISRQEGVLIHLGYGAASTPCEQAVIVEICEMAGLPCSTTASGKGTFPESHPLWIWTGVGSVIPKQLTDIIEKGSLKDILIIGARMSELARSHYTWAPRGNIFHVDVDEMTLKRSFPTSVTLRCEAAVFCLALRDCLLKRIKGQFVDDLDRLPGGLLLTNRFAQRRDYFEQGLRCAHALIDQGLRSATENSKKFRSDEGGMTPYEILRTAQNTLSVALPNKKLIFSSDSGNTTVYCMESLRLQDPHAYICPADYSCMGYSVPAAVGAALRDPANRICVACVGDGAFLMTGSAIVVAKECNLAVVVLIFRDYELGMMSGLQRCAGKQPFATQLPELDYGSLCQAWDIDFRRVRSGGELQLQLEQYTNSSKILTAESIRQGDMRGSTGYGPLVIECPVDYSRAAFFTAGVLKIPREGNDTVTNNEISKTESRTQPPHSVTHFSKRKKKGWLWPLYLQKIVRHGQKCAIVCEATKEEHTYDDMRKFVERLGSFLASYHRSSRAIEQSRQSDAGNSNSDGDSESSAAMPVVGIMLPNCSSFVTATFAVMSIGGTVVNINVHLAVPEIIHVLRSAPCVAIVAHTSYATKVGAVVQQLSELRKKSPGVRDKGSPELMPPDFIIPDILWVDESKIRQIQALGDLEDDIPHDIRDKLAKSWLPSNNQSIADAVAACQSSHRQFLFHALTYSCQPAKKLQSEAADITGDFQVGSSHEFCNDVFQVYFTSGTSGKPKLVSLTYENVHWHTLGCIVDFGICDTDVWGHVAPMFHLVDAFAVLAVTFMGGKHEILSGSAADPFLLAKFLHCRRITITNLASSMLNLLVKSGCINSYSFPSLRMISCGGSPLGAEIVTQALGALPTACQFFLSYGMTECCGKIATSLFSWLELQNMSADEKLHAVSSCGRPFSQVEIRIDASGASDGESSGEILIRGPTVFAGYSESKLVQDSVLSSGTSEENCFMGDGWFRTGDVGYIDKYGYLHVIGRCKEMMLCGGENVYPREVEDVILELPSVKEACAFSVQDPHGIMGEIVHCAVTVASQDAFSENSEKTLTAHCRAKLAYYKVPQKFHFLESLPKSGSGKVMRRELEKLFQSIEHTEGPCRGLVVAEEKPANVEVNRNHTNSIKTCAELEPLGNDDEAISGLYYSVLEPLIVGGDLAGQGSRETPPGGEIAKAAIFLGEGLTEASLRLPPDSGLAVSVQYFTCSALA